MYITYDEYYNMGGLLDETAFNNYAYKAGAKIKAETHNRIKAPSEAVKQCQKELINLYAKADVTQPKVNSFSHDGVSQSIAEVSTEEYLKKIDETIYDYLIHECDEKGTPLLYRGVDAH